MAGITHGRGGTEFVAGGCPRHLVGELPITPGPPVRLLDEADGVRHWLVTGYEAGRELLRNPHFSRARSAEQRHPRGPATRMSVTDMDPPRHTRIRHLVSKAFSARRVAELRPEIERLAEELLDQLTAASDGADLLRDFCTPLTFRAQSELLGVPPARRDVIFQLANERLGPPGAGPDDIHRGELRLYNAVADMLHDRHEPPRGLLGALITAHEEGQLGTEDDLTGLAASLFFDGHALAAAQIANAVHCVLSSPGLSRRLRADRTLLNCVVEESLRYSPAVNLSMTRTATADVEFAGASMRAGDQVSVALPLANRDDTVYPDAHRFGTERPASGHLSFGRGAHFCLGAHLARTEISVALTALLDRVPHLQLAVPPEEMAWWVSSSRRSLTSLPVLWWGARRQAA
ncbi:cytochrome P450 [Streptomyces monticola]|uniref:Cytochrome P450 n=1 Tax=Streptomyces monticola TaxID=2666263 RepID=A0ABW2JUZ0_9ACTN